MKMKVRNWKLRTASKRSMDGVADVFVYTGTGGAEVPDDVVRVRVDPSVTSIPGRAFYQRRKLAEVELCEGLVEIGDDSFADCNHFITKFIMPNSLRRINDYAFFRSLGAPIRLHDGIESIGCGAFAGCIFINFRNPSLITGFPRECCKIAHLCFPSKFPKK
jgi:hypothetical protein